MRKDQLEELRRLEEALLEQEAPEEDDWQEEDDSDEWLEEFYSSEPVHCDVYNTDEADLDLEEYSRDVHQGNSGGGCLIPILIFLTLVLCALVGFVLWKQGVIG